MAKKLNKLVQRIAALEKAVADFFSAPKKMVKRKAKKSAKTVKKPKAAKAASRPRKAVARVAPVAKKSKVVKRPAAKKAVRKAKRAATPSPEQLAPSGEPNFTTPTSQV